MTPGVRFFSLLTLLAVLVTGAIPQGWMPSMSRDGKMLLVICVGEETIERWVDTDGDSPLHDSEDERVMCPFSGLAADVELPSINTVTAFTPALRPRWSQRDFTHRSAGFYARYDARGPPQLS